MILFSSVIINILIFFALQKNNALRKHETPFGTEFGGHSESMFFFFFFETIWINLRWQLPAASTYLPSPTHGEMQAVCAEFGSVPMGQAANIIVCFTFFYYS